MDVGRSRLTYKFDIYSCVEGCNRSVLSSVHTNQKVCRCLMAVSVSAKVSVSQCRCQLNITIHEDQCRDGTVQFMKPILKGSRMRCPNVATAANAVHHHHHQESMHADLAS